VFHPVLIWQGAWWHIVLSFVSALLGCMTIGSALMGYLVERINIILRAVLLVAAILLIMPDFISDLIGAAVLGLIYLLQRYRLQRRQDSQVDSLS
jgi:TRAP-type uncharacterized transport system fused permease subunit